MNDGGCIPCGSLDVWCVGKLQRLSLTGSERPQGIKRTCTDACMRRALHRSVAWTHDCDCCLTCSTHIPNVCPRILCVSW